MKCYICGVKEGVVRDTVGVCRFCNVGLCLDHFIQAANVTQGGMRYTCDHSLPTPAEVSKAKAALARAGEAADMNAAA